MNKKQVLALVDNIMHMYASHCRHEAKQMVERAYSKIKKAGIYYPCCKGSGDYSCYDKLRKK